MSSESKPFHLGYRPSLDGVRGLAILLVLFGHGKLLGNGFGFFAVNTFFVLSGFLITCLLIEEFDQADDISFRHFYYRRALRLLPALVAMLVVFVGFSFFTDPHKRAVRELNEALFALFYFTNWAGIFHLGRHLSLMHTWSLSIEEQFYILWPWVLWLLLRKTSRASMLCWILLGIFLVELLRIGLVVGGTTNYSGNILPVDPARLSAGTDTRADSLLMGCFAGVLAASNLWCGRAWFRKLLMASSVVSLLGLWALAYCWEEGFHPTMICGGWLLGSCLAMFLILHLALGKGSLTHRILENPVLVYIGQVSYGLYIWHFPILKAMEQHHLPWQNMAYLLLVVPVVLLSYYLIERPCLRLKNRFEVATRDGRTMKNPVMHA